jgi:hypothetical protein
MAFSGQAPELINGRLAMMGFLAAAAAELATGESVLRQWSMQPAGIIAFFLLIIGASLVPLFRGVSPQQSFGPFSPMAEVYNGRIAMLGFAGLLIFEYINGRAFF